jgi:ribosomal protein RSM22 (predicted rRNA methylase)
VTARSLPPSLREAIAQVTRDMRPAALAQHAARLSDIYRARGTSQVIASDADIAAYLTARLPATYAAIIAALDWTIAAAPGFAPASVLDMGAGPGTASWAAAEILPSLARFALIDRNRGFLDMARRLSAGSPRLREADIAEGDIASVNASHAADLVLAAYALSELSDRVFEEAVPRLWAATKGVLLMVEPGTPAGFARIRRARTLLLRDGARIVAPCPGSYDCPIVGTDWCHFAARLPRLGAHMRAKAARVPFEDEKFSYLAVARGGVTVTPPAARILARPHALKHATRLRLCTEGEIAEREIAKRDKDAHRALARKDWGDAI